LSKLSGALEVPITAFFRLEPDRKNIVFCQAGDRMLITQACGMWESMGGDGFTGKMEAYKLTLQEGGGSNPYPVTHSGSEFVYVVSGQLSCVVNEQEFTLNAGDSLLFEAGLSHTWVNQGPETASAIILVAAFEDDERPGEYHLAIKQSDV
jgi:mannose-6-phosphate isomerase-like protein (cupin superfamily)